MWQVQRWKEPETEKCPFVKETLKTMRKAIKAIHRYGKGYEKGEQMKLPIDNEKITSNIF